MLLQLTLNFLQSLESFSGSHEWLRDIPNSQILECVFEKEKMKDTFNFQM